MLRKAKPIIMKTIPTILGFRGFRYIHLLGVLVTTFISWSYSDLSWIYLVGIWIIGVGTYNLTKR